VPTAVGVPPSSGPGRGHGPLSRPSAPARSAPVNSWTAWGVVPPCDPAAGSSRHRCWPGDRRAEPAVTAVGQARLSGAQRVICATTAWGVGIQAPAGFDRRSPLGSPGAVRTCHTGPRAGRRKRTSGTVTPVHLARMRK